MKSSKLFLLQLLACVLLISASLGQSVPSPAEQKIAALQKAVDTNPGRHDLYADLAFGYARRARETADPAYYDKAEESVNKSFSIMPGNIEAKKVRIWILLGRHEFARAREEARNLNRKVPDDMMVYGLLADANAELGNYEEAEEAVQWMLDMRPGSVAGLTRAAYLREIFGDSEGSLEMLNSAYQRTPPAEIEDRAWILTHMAHLHVMNGKIESAEKLLGQAFTLFPGYHYALVQMAKVRTSQERYKDAVELLRQRYQAARHPENLYDLAVALKKAGSHRESKRAFAEFEKKALAESSSADNANRELIFFYADHAKNPTKALQIARQEIDRRQDLYTRDALAWALHLNGKHQEASKQIGTALAVGIRDAKIFYHAGLIALKSRDREAAVRYLKQAIETNPLSEISDAAREELSRLGYHGI
jgi:tetratricopeptide (TPR) repeat protein